MLIDWFTVGAQTLNFLVLAWLLKRFLYKPIRDAIDAREAGIAGRLAAADAKQAKAQRAGDEFARKHAQFEQQRSALLTQASEDAHAERCRLLEASRQQAEALRSKQQDALRAEQLALNDEIVRRTRAEVFAIARQLLAELAGTTLEQRMVEVFVRRLRELDGAVRTVLVQALQATPRTALVRSAFALLPAQRGEIEQAIGAFGTSDIALRFEVAPDLISGIELSVDGQKLAWSIAAHIGSLENSVAELLKPRQAAPDAPAAGATATPAATPAPAAAAAAAAAGPIATATLGAPS